MVPRGKSMISFSANRRKEWLTARPGGKCNVGTFERGMSMYINVHHSASSRSFHGQCWRWEIFVSGASGPEPIIWVRCSFLGKPPENRCFGRFLPQGLRVPNNSHCLKIPRLTTTWRLDGSDQQLRQTWILLRVQKEKTWDHNGLRILEPGWIVLQEKSRGVTGLSSKLPSYFPPSFPQRASFSKRNSHNCICWNTFFTWCKSRAFPPRTSGHVRGGSELVKRDWSLVVRYSYYYMFSIQLARVLSSL